MDVEAHRNGANDAFWPMLLREFRSLFILGVIVGLLMAWVDRTDFGRTLDRTATDWLIQYIAQRDLAPRRRVAYQEFRVVYVDVGQKTCEKWASESVTGSHCTLDTITSRKKLADLIRALKANRPRLVVIDIELAKLTVPVSLDADAELCKEILELANAPVPVIALRPLVVDTTSSLPVVTSYPSILDPGENCQPKDTALPKNLWFGSSLVLEDNDGVVRSVPRWHVVQRVSNDVTAAGLPPTQRLPGLGFLAAALLDENPDPNLACLLVASKPGATPCVGSSINVSGHPYDIDLNKSGQPDRIMFGLPYDPPEGNGEPDSIYAPSVIETVEASQFADRLNERDVALPIRGDIVVIGGSYRASGDLHLTPLGANMPGGMIHANALWAYHEHKLVNEPPIWHRWLVELSLIAVAASIRALASSARRPLATYMHPYLRPMVVEGLPVVGIALAVIAVILIALHYNLWLIGTGTVLAIVTPALLVALEGLCAQLHRIKTALDRRGDRRAYTGRV